VSVFRSDLDLAVQDATGTRVGAEADLVLNLSAGFRGKARRPTAGNTSMEFELLASAL
jgi:hypothetical protein